MKAVYLNPFVESVVSIMEHMLYETPMRGKAFVRTAVDSTDGDCIAIIIGVTGGLSGQVALVLPKDCAKQIAAKLLREERMHEFDDIARSALGEIANMITAHATIGLSDAGCVCDITPPTVIAGNSVAMKMPENIKTIVIPLQLSMGSIDLNVSLEEGFQRQDLMN